jgi:DUF4097 and DUF4098 domain-containing protein YvlB
LLLVSPSIGESDQWSKTFTVTGTPRLTVKAGDAHIHVSTVEGNSIEARVTTENVKIGDGVRIYDRQNGDDIELEVRFPIRWFQINFGRKRVDVELRVPPRTNLDLNTGDGNVDLRGVGGEVTLHTGDGRVVIAEVAGTVRATTGDGPVRIRDARGDLTIKTGDGGVEAEGVDGALRVETGDGRVRLGGRFDVLDVKTGDGGVEVSALAGSKLAADWSVRTGDGDVTLRVPGDLAADVEVNTGDGQIDLGVPVTISGRMGSKRIKGQMNGGGKLLFLKSGDGSIRIERL